MADKMRAAVYAKNGEGDELTGLKAMRVNIVRDNRVIGSPVESGQFSFDNKVLDPTKVTVSGIIEINNESNYQGTIAKLRQMWENRDFTFYYATDGINTANNLILKTFPTLRDVDKFDFIQVELTFVEAMLVSNESMIASDFSNSDCVNVGFMNGVKQ